MSFAGDSIRRWSLRDLTWRSQHAEASRRTTKFIYAAISLTLNSSTRELASRVVRSRVLELPRPLLLVRAIGGFGINGPTVISIPLRNVQPYSRNIASVRAYKVQGEAEPGPTRHLASDQLYVLHGYAPRMGTSHNGFIARVLYIGVRRC